MGTEAAGASGGEDLETKHKNKKIKLYKIHPDPQ